MDYSISDRVARRNGDDVVLPPTEPDESLIADPRFNIRSSALVERRLYQLLGDTPLPFGESWNQSSRARPGVIALEMVGELNDTE